MKNQLMRVFSLIVVLFIILGIPALLITISNPLAALDTVGGSIASIDGSITFLLQVFIPLIAWVGWASLVIPIITETIARARRVDAVQLPGILRVQQNVAAVLIGLIFASGAGFSNAVAVEAASSAAPAPVATSVSAPATVQAQQAAPNASEMRQASQSGPSYMVNGAQTLWGIAETTLGDGNRWDEIFVLNQNVVQNDGQALTSPDQWLNDGWVLTLPQDARLPQLIHPEQSVTIQPGDTLSEIALEHYGSLEAYHFIAGESARQVQPDGTMIQDADLIQPGWQFTLPGATAAPSSTPSSESSVPPASVPGTQETGAAEAHSATIPGASAPSENAQKSSAAAATPTASAPAVSAPTADAPSASAHPSSAAVSDASTSADESGIGTSAAHGRPKTDTAPATPNTPAAVAPPAASTPATSAPSQAPTVTESPAKPANAQDSAASVPGGAIASESAGADSAETHHIETAGSTQNAQAEETVEDQSFNPVLTGGALLASGLLAAFAARRWSQRRRRRPGQRRPLSSAAAQTLTQLEAEAAPLGLKELDCGLRIISAHCAAINQPIPVLKFLTLDDSKANLYFASDVQLPYPFEGTEDANCWTLPLSSVRETPTPEVAAPYPALITLGDDRSGSAMMLNLEHAGTLQISDPLQSTSAGFPVSEMMGSFAAELLLSPWAEGLRMTFIGVEDSFLTQIAASQIAAYDADQAQQVLETLTAQAEELTGWLEREGYESIAQARAAGADAFPPHIVIVSDAVDELIRWDLMNVVRSLPHVAIAVISHASTLEAESAYNLLLMREAHADLSDLVVKLDPLGVCLVPRLLTSDEAEMVLNLLQEASADPVSPAPDDELLEPLDVSEDDEVQVEDSTFEEQEEQVASAEEAVPEVEQEEEEPEEEPAVPSYESGLSPEEMRAETRQIFTHLFGDTEIYRALVEQGNALTHLTDAEVAHPFLALLGPVRLLGAAGPVPRTKTNEPSWGLMDRYAAAAAFLHLHPSVTAESYHAAFWPHEHHSAQSAVSKRNQLTGRVRQWLGTSSDGQQYLPHATAGNYSLSELVTSDWSIFQALTGTDLKDQPTACLLAAFSLVRGVPLDGKASHYTWAERDREEMRDRIIDVAHELLARAQEAQDHRLILQVARQARAIDGSQEAFWTAEIHEEILANNAQKAQDLKNQFMDYLAAWDEEPTDDAAKVLNLAA